MRDFRGVEYLIGHKKVNMPLGIHEVVQAWRLTGDGYPSGRVQKAGTSLYDDDLRTLQSKRFDA